MTTQPQLSSISARLVEALRATSVTQAALAARLRCATSTVSHWVNGHRGLSTSKIEDIAAALGIRRAWLGYGDGTMVDADVPQPPAPTTPTPRTRKPRASKRTLPGPVKARTPKRAPKAEHTQAVG